MLILPPPGVQCILSRGVLKYYYNYHSIHVRYELNELLLWLQTLEPLVCVCYFLKIIFFSNSYGIIIVRVALWMGHSDNNEPRISAAFG